MQGSEREFQLQIANAERRWARRMSQAAMKAKVPAASPSPAFGAVAPPSKHTVRGPGAKGTLVSRRAVVRPDEDASAAPVDFDTTERILGDNDLLSYGFLQRGFQTGRAVGRIHIKSRTGRTRGFGTGFLISPRLLVTNNHVLKSANQAGESRLELDFVHTADGGATPPVIVRIVPSDFWLTSVPLDFTVVAVAPETEDGRQVSEWGWISLAGRAGVEKDDPVNIIQHPGGEPKQVAIRANKVVDSDDDFVRYRTDTAPGTSGGPLLGDGWELLGVHHSGVPKRDQQGRILADDGSRWRPAMGEQRIDWVSNEGILIDSIVDHLASVSLKPRARQLLDAALQLETVPPSEAARSATPRIVAPDEPSEPTVHPDGRVSLTLPLHVSLRLGGDVTAALTASQPPAGPSPRDADGPDGGSPAVDDGPAGSVEAAAKTLAERIGGRDDILEVRAGWLFEDGWITDDEAIEVVVKEKLLPGDLNARSIEPLPATYRGYPVDVVAAAPTELLGVDEELDEVSLTEADTTIDYEPPDHLSLDPVDERMRVIAHTGPDAGFVNLKAFIERTRKSLVVAMYDFTAPHILEVLLDHFGSNTAKLKLVIQRGSSGGGSPKVREDEAIRQLEDKLGNRFTCQHAAAGGAGDLWATSYHIKVAVRDGSEFWISSGNWQSSGQPERDPIATGQTTWGVLSRANREWHTIVRNKALAEMFEGYIDYDFDESHKAMGGFESAVADRPDLFVPEGWFDQDDTFAFEGSPTWFTPLTVERKVKVQPLLTPDNYGEHVEALIRSARERVWFQNQTLKPNRRPHNHIGFYRLLDALLDQQREGLDVRIIFRDIGDTRGTLRRIKKFGFDMDQVRVHRGCHTKGLVIDEKAVLVGSHNWSEKGVLFNRDASLIFFDERITAFYAEILDWDWDNRARQREFSELFVPRLAQADEAPPPGYRRVSWFDYYQ